MNEIIIACPVCGDHPKGPGYHKHCYIYLERGRYNCYYCSSHGSLKWLVSRYPEIQSEIGYRELEESIKRATERQADTPTLRFVPLRPPYSVIANTVVEYLNHRGLTARDIIRCKVGTIHGLPYAAVFPHLTGGPAYFWAARYIMGQYKWKFPRAGATQCTKSEVVWGLERVLERQEKSVWICEGVFDALAANGVCVFGKHPAPQQIQIILKIKPEELVLALDQDAADEAYELQKKLRGIIKTRVCLPEQFNDYGEYLEKGLRRVPFTNKFKLQENV